MNRKAKNISFICAHCGRFTTLLERGFRNHCPFCLHSLHVDRVPGDRLNSCGSLMAPQRLAYHTKKGWQIVHRCLRCGQETRNVVAEGGRQPDSIEALCQLFARAPKD